MKPPGNTFLFTLGILFLITGGASTQFPLPVHIEVYSFRLTGNILWLLIPVGVILILAAPFLGRPKKDGDA